MEWSKKSLKLHMFLPNRGVKKVSAVLTLERKRSWVHSLMVLMTLPRPVKVMDWERRGVNCLCGKFIGGRQCDERQEAQPHCPTKAREALGCPCLALCSFKVGGGWRVQLQDTVILKRIYKPHSRLAPWPHCQRRQSGPRPSHNFRLSLWKPCGVGFLSPLYRWGNWDQDEKKACRDKSPNLSAVSVTTKPNSTSPLHSLSAPHTLVCSPTPPHFHPFEALPIFSPLLWEISFSSQLLAVPITPSISPPSSLPSPSPLPFIFLWPLSFSLLTPFFLFLPSSPHSILLQSLPPSLVHVGRHTETGTSNLKT